MVCAEIFNTFVLQKEKLKLGQLSEVSVTVTVFSILKNTLRLYRSFHFKNLGTQILIICNFRDDFKLCIIPFMI